MKNTTTYIESDKEPDNENVLEDELQRIDKFRTRKASQHKFFGRSFANTISTRFSMHYASLLTTLIFVRSVIQGVYRE